MNNITATFNDLEQAAKEFATSSRILRNLKENLDTEIDAIKNKYIDNIKNASVKAGEDYQLLLNLVSESETLFKDKKSITLNGVKFGFQKKKGKIEIINEEATINKLKELYNDEAKLYLNTKISVSKKALDNIPAGDLKKLGINIIEDTSEAFVKLTDDEVQKLIEAMIKESAKVAE